MGLDFFNAYKDGFFNDPEYGISIAISKSFLLSILTLSLKIPYSNFYLSTCVRKQVDSYLCWHFFLLPRKKCIK